MFYIRLKCSESYLQQEQVEMFISYLRLEERGGSVVGSVVKCLTRDLGVVCWSLTGGTALCPCPLFSADITQENPSRHN